MNLPSLIENIKCNSSMIQNLLNIPLNIFENAVCAQLGNTSSRISMFHHFDVATIFSPLLISSKAFTSPRGFYSYRCYCLISLKSITIHFIKKNIVNNERLSFGVCSRGLYLQHFFLSDFIYTRKYLNPYYFKLRDIEFIGYQ